MSSENMGSSFKLGDEDVCLTMRSRPFGSPFSVECRNCEFILHDRVIRAFVVAGRSKTREHLGGGMTASPSLTLTSRTPMVFRPI